MGLSSTPAAEVVDFQHYKVDIWLRKGKNSGQDKKSMKLWVIRFHWGIFEKQHNLYYIFNRQFKE